MSSFNSSSHASSVFASVALHSTANTTMNIQKIKTLLILVAKLLTASGLDSFPVGVTMIALRFVRLFYNCKKLFSKSLGNRDDALRERPQYEHQRRIKKQASHARILPNYFRNYFVHSPWRELSHVFQKWK